MTAVNKSGILTFCVLVTFSLSSCSFIREVTGEERPLGLSSTGLGAVTGAVLGAGAGAIIGSTTGDAGVGVAIGAGAGAALGGALGQQEARERNASAETETEDAQQDELLKANDQRIEEYKKGADDPTQSRGSLAAPNMYAKSSVSSSVINTPSGYRGNPRAVRYSDIDSASFDAEPAIAPRPVIRVVPSTTNSKVIETPITPTESVSQRTVNPAKGNPKANPVDLVPEMGTETIEPKLVPVVKTEQAVLPPAKSIEPVAKSVDDQSKGEVAKATASKGIVGVPVYPVLEPVNTDEIKTTVITGSKANKAAADDDCTRADQEYQRAVTSISDADKLFYLRRALRLCAGKPNLHLATGRVYTKLGRVDDAEYEYRQVLDLEPGNSEAAKELASLKQGSR